MPLNKPNQSKHLKCKLCMYLSTPSATDKMWHKVNVQAENNYFPLFWLCEDIEHSPGIILAHLQWNIDILSFFSVLHEIYNIGLCNKSIVIIISVNNYRLIWIVDLYRIVTKFEFFFFFFFSY